MLTRLQWLVTVTTLLSTACQPQAAATETPVIEVSTETFAVPTATPDCLPADGVTVDIQRVSAEGVTLHISGLQPGEVPYVIYSTFSKSASSMLTSGYALTGADASGEFRSDSPGLLPLPGETSATWDVRIIHSRGVECATITLP